MGYAVQAYPPELAAAVAGAKYLDWTFTLSQNPAPGASGVTFESPYAVRSGMSTAGWQVVLFPPQYLAVAVKVPDSGDRGKVIDVVHVFTVPPPGYAGHWDRFILDCIVNVHVHEAMEEFSVNGVKEFYPAHGDEGSPYEILRRCDRRKLCTVRSRQSLIQRPHL